MTYTERDRQWHREWFQRRKLLNPQTSSLCRNGAHWACYGRCGQGTKLPCQCACHVSKR